MAPLNLFYIHIFETVIFILVLLRILSLTQFSVCSLDFFQAVTAVRFFFFKICFG